MLIAAIVGLDTRSTMDLDTTLRNLPLTEEQISVALNSICKIDMNDDVSFEIKSVAPIETVNFFVSLKEKSFWIRKRYVKGFVDFSCRTLFSIIVFPIS